MSVDDAVYDVVTIPDFTRIANRQKRGFLLLSIDFRLVSIVADSCAWRWSRDEILIDSKSYNVRTMCPKNVYLESRK